jgi:hypothetical protein
MLSQGTQLHESLLSRHRSRDRACPDSFDRASAPVERRHQPAVAGNRRRRLDGGGTGMAPARYGKYLILPYSPASHWLMACAVVPA